MDETTDKPKKKRWRPSKGCLWTLAVLTVVLGLLCWKILVPFYIFLRGTMYRRNMVSIYQATYPFEEEHGHFPFLKNEQEPLVSWRVQLLPTLARQLNTKSDLNEHIDYFKKHYNKDSAWDSETNIVFLDHPSSRLFTDGGGYSIVLALTGPGTIWAETEKLNRGQLLEKYGDPAILVISPETPVPWTQPRDLVMTKEKVYLDDESSPVDLSGQIVQFLNGDTTMLPQDISDEELMNMLWTHSREK